METVATAAGAGAISAIVYTPVDLITIQQQKLVLNPIETARYIVEKHGIAGLLRGFSSCAVREALYSAGYLGLAPIFTYYVSSTSEFGSSPHGTHSLAAGICGASLAGILVSTLTHPVDTCKTCVQSDMLGRTYPSAFQTSTILYSQGGVPALFKGLIPRVTRICGAFFVCMTLRDMAINCKTSNYYRYQSP
jgi:solute carrier family 25 2-oxodicarboxylate transporter 21